MKLPAMPTAKVLAVGVLLLFAGVQLALFFFDIPEGNRDLLTRTMGTLDAALALVLNYFMGSSDGSALKTRIMAAAGKPAPPTPGESDP